MDAVGQAAADDGTTKTIVTEDTRNSNDADKSSLLHNAGGDWGDGGAPDSAGVTATPTEAGPQSAPPDARAAVIGELSPVVLDTTPLKFIEDDTTPIAKMLVSHNSTQWQWAWWEGAKGKRKRKTRYGGTYETLPQERKDEHRRNSAIYWDRKIRAATRRERAEARVFFE